MHNTGNRNNIPIELNRYSFNGSVLKARFLKQQIILTAALLLFQNAVDRRRARHKKCESSHGMTRICFVSEGGLEPPCP